MPKVSVIVPVYNVEKYIDRCLDSLVNQTLEDIEIIVVNDGSKDSSKEKILEYASKYNKIKYLEKENGGLSDARNYGLPYATGDYIAFLDSDDFVDYTLYEKMYNKAIEEEADYVECDFYWTYPHNEDNSFKNEITDIKKNCKLVEDKGYRYTNKSEMFVYARVVAWNKLFKKEVIKEKFPKGLNYEDIEFFYNNLPNIKKFAFVEEPLIYYIQRSSSIVNKQNYKTGQIFTIFQNVIDYYKKNGLYEEYKEEIEYSYVRILTCSSLKRIVKVQDSVARKKLIYETKQNIKTRFPDWKNNKFLKIKSGKNLFIRYVPFGMKVFMFGGK